uniref:TATA box-binding protein-like 1 n=1 Tax=Micrurus corallinus TaxID=54390 RepID=A0A2D4H285_MICCO
MDAESDVALDILITNVVCVFRTRCHLNLRKIALEGANVIYKRDVGKVLMKLRKPRITATIWSSGKVICTGATSEEEAKFGARRLARSLQKLGFQYATCRLKSDCQNLQKTTDPMPVMNQNFILQFATE